MALDQILSSSATREVLSIGRSRDSLINHNGDRDWFKVSLVAGNTYKFTVTRSGTFDPFLRLRGSSGTVIAENDDVDSRTRDSLINFKPTTTGVYYLDVGGFKTSTGSYRLSSSLTKAASTGSSKPTSSSLLPSRPATSRLDGIRASILPQVLRTQQVGSQDAARGASSLMSTIRSDSRYRSGLASSGLVMDPLYEAASSSSYSRFI
jgi:hypothetical protein